MEEPLDEHGGSRVPSRPTVKKKDGLDDPALTDAGPALNSPGDAVDPGPNLPKAVPEESCRHGVDESPNDGAAEVSSNPDDVAPQSDSNSGDTSPEVVSNPNDVAPGVVGGPGSDALGVILNPGDGGSVAVSKPNNVDLEVGTSSNVGSGVVVNPEDVAIGAAQNVNDAAPGAISNPKQGVVGNPGNIASGLAGNSDNDALETGQILSNVALEADVSNLDNVSPGVNPGNVVLELVLNSGNNGSVDASNLDSVAHLAGNHNDVNIGPVQNPGNVGQSEIVELEHDGASEIEHSIVTSDLDEILWSKALAEQDCNKLRVLLAKDDKYFWKYEKKNEVGTTLHAAATGGDLELAKRVLNLLSWAQEAGDLDIRFSDTRLDIDRYVDLETDAHGKTAIVVAKENNHAAVEKKIRDYIAKSLWSRALAEQDNKILTELLAEDASYFWDYEKENEGSTALHAAATAGDLELAERVLNLLSWAHEAGDLDIRFSETRLDIDRYVVLEDAQGNTATAVARENNHVAIENKIRDYIADKDKRRMNDEKRSRESTGSPDLILKWKDAIRKKDCLALLEICPNKKWYKALDVEMKLIGELVKVEMKNGKGGRRTALQTAAMQGCLQLAKLMLYHFSETAYFIRSEDWDASSFVRTDYISARDEESGLTAFEMANDVIGHRSIAEFIKYTHNDNFKRMLHLNVENDKHLIGSSKRLSSFDAYPGTRWYRALENGDTRELKKLVQANSRFILETCHGLTILHVAILLDDLELVKAVLNLFCDTSEKEKKTSIHWGSSYHPEELSLDDMMKLRRKIDHEYLNEYWKDSSKNWEPLPKRMFQKLQRKGFTVKSLAQILERKEILDVLEKALNTSTTTSTPSSPSMEHSTMPPWMCKFFDEVIWTPAFDEEFQRDVDFNFEDPLRRAWLRVHYACKNPLKFRGFLQHMAFCIMKPPYDGVKLLQTWDGKGRTPFHILMDHYNDDKVPGWPFDEIFNHECFKELIQIVENARGKRIIDTVFSKNYLQQNVTLHPWTYFKVNFNYEKFERSEVTTFLYYQIAYLLKQTDMVQEIWSRFLNKKDFTNVMKKDQDAFNSMLFLVASIGNQACLQSLLEINQDPMIIDSNGRSLLHHAADPTLLLSHVLGCCSLTVEDVCDMRSKFLDSKTIYDQQLASSTIPNISLRERSNVGRKACILMLLQAGVDLGQSDKEKKVPTIGPTIDTTDQSWWYDIVVKDSTDKKNALGQAGNALSVVGTLVAATSYVGPLQPPLSLDSETGFVKTTEPLVKVFMVSNSVAFYLAMASVMFAVVSSLPMPQEGVMSEVNRAKHVISLSLCLLQIAIGSIVISYATASIVAIQNEQLFHRSDLLFVPSITGWFFCLLGIGGFLIRLARLVFYKNQVVRNIYEISFSRTITKCLWMIVGHPLLLLLKLVCLVLVMPFICLGLLCSKILSLENSHVDMYSIKVVSKIINFL